MSAKKSKNISSSKIYFTSLHLENVKCFAEPQELKLTCEERPAQWTLILGENGVGKTTLLQCLARMRPILAASKAGGEPDSIEPELNGEESNDVLDQYIRLRDNITMEMKAVFSVDQKFESVSNNSQKIETQIQLERCEKRFKGADAGGGSKVVLERDLRIFGYGAARRMSSSNLDSSKFDDPLASLFDDSVVLYDAEDILSQLDYAAHKKKRRARDLRDKLKQALADILPDIRKPEHIEIAGPSVSGGLGEKSGVYIKTKYATVPFSQISLGSRIALAWTVDIAWRMFHEYPDSKNPLAEPAIILVDEIDLHLHPSWQRGIRTQLEKHFPNVQFIATAHSPLMAQASLDANLVVLINKGDHVVIENDPVAVDGWRVDQILTSELFGLPTARRPEVEKLILEREEILLQPEPDQDRLQELDRELDKLPTAESDEDRKAMDIIRRAAELLKNKEHDES